MIALDESKGLRGPLSEKSPAMEIYEELLRYRGRTVRVQESTLEPFTEMLGRRGEQTELSYERRLFKEQVGVLSKLRLKYSGLFYTEGNRESETNAYLAVFLDDEALTELRLKNAQIQVLQEDSGNWEIFFRGSGWTDYDKSYLRIYSR